MLSVPVGMRKGATNSCTDWFGLINMHACDGDGVHEVTEQVRWEEFWKVLVFRCQHMYVCVCVDVHLISVFFFKPKLVIISITLLVT